MFVASQQLLGQRAVGPNIKKCLIGAGSKFLILDSPGPKFGQRLARCYM